ncbi:hypothetical protein DFH06DRAFT_1133600 [Mycena polygramma]|nr:hypothetical protein DFH06DRAFT_1133600 [Mycena polygramma]
MAGVVVTGNNYYGWLQARRLYPGAIGAAITQRITAPQSTHSGKKSGRKTKEYRKGRKKGTKKGGKKGTVNDPIASDGSGSTCTAVWELGNFPFTHVKRVPVIYVGALSAKSALDLQQLFNLPTVVQVRLMSTTVEPKHFLDMFQRCSPAMKHLDLYFSVHAPLPALPIRHTPKVSALTTLSVQSFRPITLDRQLLLVLHPFTFTNLRALNISASPVEWLDLAPAMKALEILGIHNMVPIRHGFAVPYLTGRHLVAVHLACRSLRQAPAALYDGRHSPMPFQRLKGDSDDEYIPPTPKRRRRGLKLGSESADDGVHVPPVAVVGRGMRPRGSDLPADQSQRSPPACRQHTSEAQPTSCLNTIPSTPIDRKKPQNGMVVVTACNGAREEESQGDDFKDLDEYLQSLGRFVVEPEHL